MEPSVSTTGAHPLPVSNAQVAEAFVSPTAQAPARCAQGAKGGKWKGNTSTLFLNECLPFRRDLRGLRVADKVFKDISDAMWYTHKLDYSWEQLKEKVRSLKRYFSEAKQGKHGGTNWPHYWLMVHIYDAELDVDVTIPRRCKCPSKFLVEVCVLLYLVEVVMLLFCAGLNFQSSPIGSINVTVSHQNEQQPSSRSSNVVSSSPTVEERDRDEQDNCMGYLFGISYLLVHFTEVLIILLVLQAWVSMI